MAIEPKYLPFKDLLTNRLFYIPEYQRSYAWKPRQRGDLFKDILSVLDYKDDRSHFMATIVCLDKNKKKDIGLDEYHSFDIVDGQQRITTLLILLKTIALSLNKKKDKKTVDYINSMLVKDGGKVALLTANHDESMIFENYLKKGKVPESSQIKIISEQNVYDAIKECKKFVNDNIKIVPDIIKIINHRLTFVYYTLSDERTVYTVFEVLNSRGLEVDWLDKCKSMLMGVASENSDDEHYLLQLKKIWTNIYKLIGNTSQVGYEILNITATLKKDGNIKKPLSSNASIDYFKTYCEKDPQKAVVISDWLKCVTERLIPLHTDRRKSAVTKILHARLLAVAINLSSSLSEEEKIIALRHWEKISFKIFGLARKDARTGIGDYVTLARKLVSGSECNIVELKDDLNDISNEYPIEDVMQQIHRHHDSYNGWEESLRYLLFKYEEHLCEESNESISDTVWEKIWNTNASNTIEHIYPQSPDEAWNGFIGRGAKQHEKFVNKIGNMILLPPGLNSSLGRKSFVDKKEEYKKLGLRHVTEISNKHKWTKDNLEARQEKIEDWMKDEWE